MKIGDRVRFKNLEGDSYIHVNDYFTDEIGEHLIHGGTEPCVNPIPVIVAIVKDLFVVRYTDQNNEIVQLGFKKSFLEVIGTTGREDITGRYVKAIKDSPCGIQFFSKGMYAKITRMVNDKDGDNSQSGKLKLVDKFDSIWWWSYDAIGDSLEVMPEGFNPKEDKGDKDNKENLVGRYIKSLQNRATGVSTFNKGVYAKLVSDHEYGHKFRIVGENIKYSIDNTSIGVNVELMSEWFKLEHMDVVSNNDQKEYKEGDICVWEDKDVTDCIRNGEIFKIGGKFCNKTKLGYINNYNHICFISKGSPIGDGFNVPKKFRKATSEETYYYNRIGLGTNINNILPTYTEELIQPVSSYDSIYDCLIDKKTDIKLPNKALLQKSSTITLNKKSKKQYF